jgi:protease-4
MPPGMMPPPPPGMYPPPMMFYPPPPPPPAGRGFSKGILVTLATTIFGLSLMLNLYLLIYSGLFGGGAAATRTTVETGEETQKVAVIPIHGVITDATSTWVTRWLKEIEQDPNIKALVLDVDTPGGGVTPSDEIHHRIQRLRKVKEEAGATFPIAVSMGALATSGGYYVSSHPKVEIFAQPTTLTGNIGVLMPRFNLSELAKKWGVNETTLTAPEGGFKNAGSMFQPDKPEDSAYLQGIINEAYGNFRDIVKTGREGKLKGPLSEIANGQVFTFQQAMDKGLVDQKGYVEDAWKWAAQTANLSKPTVVRYHAPASFLYLFLNQWTGAAPATAGKDVNVDVKLDARLLDELASPRLLYLWRGE